MPELPEVETTCRALKKYVIDQVIDHLIIRQHSLRWPITAGLEQKISDQKILNLSRRGKYLLFQMSHGILILHLGMSGRLNIFTKKTELKKHDHVDIYLKNGNLLRYHDPRRFGAILWTEDALEQHPLFKHLGIEPLSKSFTGAYLYTKTRARSTPIKSFLMNSKLIVGIGNIYAQEALFIARIHPQKPAKNLSQQAANDLVAAIKLVLRRALKSGGTTFRDFQNPLGTTGYFQNKLQVYGRETKPCINCNKELQLIRMNGRSTVFCARCQK